MSVLPFKVKAVFDYTSPHEDDLHFSNGQIITVTDEEDADWYSGKYIDADGVKQEGIFPRNFVEKYEPTAPPRPTRTARPKKEAEHTPVVPLEPAQAPAAPQHEETVEPVIAAPIPQREVEQPAPPKPEPAISAPSQPVVPASVPAPQTQKPVSSASKSPPPPAAEKPIGSFRDRIAAFNKAAPPPTPFKPGGLGSGGSSFIKKPFVAPPPSKDAYIPPPREVPTTRIYKREEDPEIAARESENLENAERAGLAAHEGDEENQPKPTTLKERIALLQKQQAEQAARHADVAAKKEKPKRPVKKRTESSNATEGHDEATEEVPLEKTESHDYAGKRSTDSAREEVARHQPPRRKSSKGPSAVPGAVHESTDGNDADMSGAGDETEEPEEFSARRDDSDDRPAFRAPPPGLPHRAPAAPLREPDVGEEEGLASEDAEEVVEEEEEGEEEEDDVDPEIRRKEEIRARMAKMSGGMGMHGMFGPPGGMPMPGPAPLPKKKKSTTASENRASGEYGDNNLAAAHAPPVPMMALPGLSRVRNPEEFHKPLEPESEVMKYSITAGHDLEEVPDVEDIKPVTTTRAERPAPPQATASPDSFNAPPIPGGRPAPPPVPSESRPVPPPLTTPASPSAGSESDDEMSRIDSNVTLKTPTGDAPSRPLAPPGLPARPAEGPGSPKSANPKRVSYFATESSQSPTSPTTPGATNKRASRVPPIPGSSPAIGSQTRAPPPPPPAPSLSRSSTGDARFVPMGSHAQQQESEEEVTEYEGDYDTDIASTVPHKDALKSHNTELSEDDSISVRPSGVLPLLPPSAWNVPPPLPSQPPPHSRQSADMPRAAPPPPPPPKAQTYEEDDAEEDEEDYDPYKYSSTKSPLPTGRPAPPPAQSYDEDLYSASPPRTQPPPPSERAARPPPPRDMPPAPSERAAPPPPPRDLVSPLGRAPPRPSADIQRIQQSSTRRSTDLGRMSMDHGFIANEVDLAEGSLWWTQPNSLPPSLQGRKDILHETEESSTSKRGGKTIVSKDIYVLFPDYSQTIINVRFDAHNPSDASVEQEHKQPPSRLRQDQLEDSYETFGRKISEAVVAHKEKVVGDGTPAGLVAELLKPFPNALLPVGTRAYGALVYSNIGNATTTQNDEIRPGDIITFRNARFQGKHGAVHVKYNIEVGAGSGHVGVVSEWDGTKKKIRAWEQGRESKKARVESFKLDDLRSGEVKIWRVMPRSWVGWEGQN